MSIRFKFNETLENWKAIAENALRETDGVLHLIDEETGKPVDAEIVFLYSTSIYYGLQCQGIVRIGQDIGSVLVSFTGDSKAVFFEADSTLTDMGVYNKKIREIVEDMDEDCLDTEARHVHERYGTDSMKTLVKQYHAMQRRNNNPEIPYTEHLYGVASVLKTISESCNEIPKDTLEFMVQAALGHDLLEDTAIEEDTIERTEEDVVLELIRELTNPNDDSHTDEYMEKIAEDSEEARLIKYADLIENTSSFCYALHEPNIEDPVQRAKAFYLPILTRTTAVLEKTEFSKYPKTAEAMRMVLKVYADMLQDRIGLLEGR